MTTTLVILNDPPYGTERSYNALRLATSLAKRDGEIVRGFLKGDAASCARAGHKMPSGTTASRPCSRRLAASAPASVSEGLAWTPEGSGSRNSSKEHRNSMDELTAWTVELDKIIVF